MEYRDGRRILVGRDCARKIWGVDFDLLIKDFDLARNAAYYLTQSTTPRDAKLASILWGSVWFPAEASEQRGEGVFFFRHRR